ncbi:MAG: GGDEF domain-containing protein [Lachnospiraceae bacterium]|nr:GGDEF domain-containing protein [Lachnospiraceae bacterium]
MNKETYLDNIISTIENNIDSNAKKVVFINNHSNFVLSKNRIQNLLVNSAEFVLLTHTFKSDAMQGPYEPFMDWIRDIYIQYYKEEISEVEFLKECEVYTNQMEVFTTFLKTGHCVRKEDVIMYEVNYEKEKFIISLLNIFKKLSKDRTLYLSLNRLHLAHLSTIKLLVEILKSIDDFRIGLFVTYDKSIEVYNYMKKQWRNLIKYVDDNELDFDLSSFLNIKSEQSNKQFIPKVIDTKEYRLKVNNMLQCMAQEQAAYYLSIIYQKIEREKFNISSMEKFNLLAIYALVTLQEHDAGTALMLCKVMQAHVDTEKNASCKFVYHYLMCMTQIELMQIKVAIEYALECVDIANNMNNKYLLFKAKILYVNAKCYGWKVANECTNLGTVVDDLEELLAQYGFLNTLAYYNLNQFAINRVDYELYRDVSRNPHISKTLNMAEKIENNSLILYAYERMIVKSSSDGHHLCVDDLYHKYAELLKKLSKKYKYEKYNEFPYDGIGYNYVIRERYVQANEFFNESIRISYKKKNVENIASTFYNKAINAIIAKEYAIADEYLSSCFKVMSYIGITTIFQCNASKLYGLRALCNYYLDMEYKSYVNLNVIERLLLHIVNTTDEQACAMWDDDLFLYHFVKALLHKNNDDLDLAEIEFKIAKVHMERSSSFMFCSYPMYAMEVFELYCRIQKVDEGNKVLEDCIKFCEKNGYTIKKEQLENKLLGKKSMDTRYRLGMKKNELQMITDMARKVGNKIKDESRQKEITFLSNWQDFLRKDRTTTALFGKEALSMLKDTFSFDGILYIDVVNKKPQILYSDLDKKLSKEEIDYISSFFRTRNNMLAVSRMDKVFNEYDQILNIFDKSKIHTLVGIPLVNDNEMVSVLIAFMNYESVCRLRKAVLSQHQLSIVKYAFQQLNNAILKNNRRKEIRQINKNLQKLVVTDRLTSLYNRQGFTKKLNEYANSESKLAILYIDLDNFKFYNDNFGHYIGDKILIMFADKLKRLLGKNDIAVRYGGDEFIIVKEMKEIEEILELARQFSESMKTDFRAQVMKVIGDVDIDIPENKLLSCSIGISELSCETKEEINDALRKADKALYAVKRKNKGGFELIDNLDLM